MLKNLDRRVHAYTEGMADKRLFARAPVEQQTGWRLLDSVEYQVTKPMLGLHTHDCLGSSWDNQLLLGEKVRVFQEVPNLNNDWAWVQLLRDDYVGYVSKAGLSGSVQEVSHRVSVPMAPCFIKPDIKSMYRYSLALNARINVLDQHERFSQIAPEVWLMTQHLAKVDVDKSPEVSALLSLAQGFIDTPYVWGGNTRAGIDCSGLIQMLFAAFGVSLPRDSDQQQMFGNDVSVDAIAAADLVFWQGHVGVMVDDHHLMHANAHHMRTVIEPLMTVQQRIAKKFDRPILAIKRLIEGGVHGV